MNQNYGFGADYGTSLITHEVSGYGTLNPGPGTAQPLMDGPLHGEVMGTASDGSSLASHAPVVHAMQVQFPGAPDHGRFVNEGTVVLLVSDEACTPAEECDNQDKFVAKAYVHGDVFDGSLEKTTVITAYVVASAAQVTKTAAVMLSMAMQSTITVQLDSVEHASHHWKPGTLIYATGTKKDGRLALALTDTWEARSTTLFVKALGRVLVECYTERDSECLLCLVPC